MTPWPPSAARAFAWVTKNMRDELHAAGISVPLVSSNRTGTPEVAKQLLADGCADMVGLARASTTAGNCRRLSSID